MIPDLLNLFALLCIMSLVRGKILAPNIENVDNSDVETFISKYLSLEPITFIYGNTTTYSFVLRVNFSKVLYKYQLEEKITGSENNSSYIFVLNSPQSIGEALEKCTKSDNWNNRQPILLIVDEYIIKRRDIKQIFHDFWKINAFNVVIYNKNNTFYTWHPYEKRSNCGKEISLIKVGANNPYVGKIPKRVHGCQINITWCDNFYKMDPFKDNLGSQVLFMNTLATAMNLNVSYLKNNAIYIKSFYRSQNNSELLEDMRRRNIDMALYIGFIHPDIPVILENSAIFFDGSLYFILPSRKIVINKNYVVDMFTPEVTITTACSLILICIVCKLLSGLPITEIVFVIAQLTLQMSTAREFTRPTRILLLCFLVFVICLNTAYQSQTSSLLTKPSFTTKIETVEQLMFQTDIKIKVYSNSDKFVYYNGTRHDFKNRTIPARDNISIYDHLKDFAAEDSYAVTMSSIFKNYFKNYEKLEIVKRNDRKLSFFLKTIKGLPLLHNINYWIEEMRGKGFSEKYGSQYINPSEKLYAKEPGYLTKRPLGLLHVQGAFHIIMFGNLIAIVVFLIELFLIKN